MTVRFETTVPDDPRSALARAEELLNRCGFAKEAEGRYVRGSRWGSGASLNARKVYTTLALTFNGNRVLAELNADPMRTPNSTLERHLWRGEMDDLRSALEGLPGAGLDREREDRATAVLVGATLVAMCLAIALAFVVFELSIPWALAMSAFPLIVYAVFPFRMPRYLASARPRDLSNYPR